MPFFGENHVKLRGGIVVWDGVTSPETQTQGANAGKPKWSLKCVYPPNSPDVGEFNQLAGRALQNSKWRGVLPQGGRMPVGQVQPGELQGMFTGWHVISFKTSLRAPDVFDENGQPLDPMQYSRMMYTGMTVDVLAGVYEYDSAGNRGISASLEGFAIIASANSPRLSLGGVNAAAAFGASGAQQPPQYPGAPAAQPQYPGAPAAQPQYPGAQQPPQYPHQAGFIPGQQ